VPGLVLAVLRPERSLVLLDAAQRRTGFLREAVDRLGLASRVQVVTDRAEVAGRSPDLRSSFDAVVARSFGPPAVTAECAAGFLPVGGVLVVSEPPADEEPEGRWPPAGLAELGFGPAVRLGTATAGFVRIPRVEVHDRWPRRVGIPAKRPRW
jgi:16S rRNA (guanine527-N7)-methyltransferase